MARRLLLRMRVCLLRVACRLLLPRGIWIGKHFGAYTRRYDIVFGRPDDRGVLQGVLDQEILK